MTDQQLTTRRAPGYEWTAQPEHALVRTRGAPAGEDVDGRLHAGIELRRRAEGAGLAATDTGGHSTAAESSLTPWIDLGRGIRLQLTQGTDGWGWHDWQHITRRDGWQPCGPPDPEDVARRFSSPTQAVRFFRLLAGLTR